ncbi:MAG: CHASE2 domain-containing protein [Candidatus Tectimicrobiota bacterium]
MIAGLSLSPVRVSGLATAFCLLLYLLTFQVPLVRNLEATLLDTRLQLRGSAQPQAPVALILIDDKSITALGRWPWSRSRFADMLRHLHTAGARVVVFDVLFSEAEEPPAHTPLQTLLASFEALELPSASAALQAFHHTLIALVASEAPDRSLATALAEAGNALLAFTFDSATPTSLPGLASPPPAWLSAQAYRTFRRPAGASPFIPLQGHDVFGPLPPLAEAAAALGHVKIAFDTDGTPRYDYPVIAYQDAYYPSLPLQALRLYLGLPMEAVRVHFGEGLWLGELFVPTDEGMRQLIRYYGPPGTFPTYSFVDVLAGRVPAAAFQQRIVLLGAAATGLGDTFVTPFSNVLPGVERHATVIANVLRGETLRRRDSTAWLDLGTILALGLTLGWLASILPWAWGGVLSLALGGTYVGLNILALTRWDLWLNLLFPCLTVAGNYGAITLYTFCTEARQRRRLRRAFQYYLHPSLVDRLAQHPELLVLGGETRELTVLFADIRGFSSFAEALAPEVLVRVMNEYFNAMTRAVVADHGLLDKYIGDAVMAVYGAPLLLPDHAYRACHTALCMLEAVQQLQPCWRARGLPAIAIGIGINSGPMVVGNIGSDVHFAYTVIGDEVNLGSRLEGVNKEYGTHILISEATWMQVKERIVARELDIIRVKGKDAPTRIFEVLGLMPPSPQQAALLRVFALALAAYRASCWEAAMQGFQQVLQMRPDDAPSQLYLQRCATFQTTPPPPDWDGIYVMQTK